LDKATHPDPQLRFVSVAEALIALKTQKPEEATAAVEEVSEEQPKPIETVSLTEGRVSQQELREERVEWLRSLLQSYPGSLWGNRETRGLDSEFAAQTYVETALEETLDHDIRERRVRLVILCGNAGDGKTALLQRLASRLGLGEHQSSKRIL